jgi:hypothetical protein
LTTEAETGTKADNLYEGLHHPDCPATSTGSDVAADREARSSTLAE